MPSAIESKEAHPMMSRSQEVAKNEHVMQLQDQLAGLYGVTDILGTAGFQEWIMQSAPQQIPEKGKLFVSYLRQLAHQNVPFGLSADPLSLHADEQGKPPESYFSVTSHRTFTGDFHGLLPSAALPYHDRASHLGFWIEDLRTKMLNIFGDTRKVKSAVWLGQKVSANLFTSTEESVFKMTAQQRDSMLMQKLIRLDPNKGWQLSRWVDDFLDENWFNPTRTNWYLSDKYGTQLVSFLSHLHYADGWEEKIKRLVLGPEYGGESEADSIMTQREEFFRQFERFIFTVRIAMDDGHVENMMHLREDQSIDKGSVVVEVDPVRLYEDTGGIGMHYYGGNPATTIVHWRVQLPAIRCLYANRDLAHRLAREGYPAEVITRMPESYWAGGVDPGNISKLGPQFWRLFHGSPDENNQKWIHAVQNGLSVPVLDTVYSTHTSNLLHSFDNKFSFSSCYTIG